MIEECPMCHSKNLIEDDGLECQDCGWHEEPGELDGLEDETKDETDK